MELLHLNRFKPYRVSRWIRTKYLWEEQTNPWLKKYRIRVTHGKDDPADVLVIPCPHLPGREAMVHQDEHLWITQGHCGELEYMETPMLCDSSMDYAWLDPVMRDLISYPQVRGYMTGVHFRDPVVQQRRGWGGEYYGMVYKQRELYESGPNVREDRLPLPEHLTKKILPPNRPPTPPMADAVFEHIAARIRPLKERGIDLLFSGRTLYHPVGPNGQHNHPTAHRRRLEQIWDDLPGKHKLMKTYDNFEGTMKGGRRVRSFRYPYEYIDALLDTKVVISPWGWSPWCVRDLEALACGCIVIKPECSNMLIYPDIYNPQRQLMVWADIMYACLPEQLNYCYTHLDEFQERVDRGRKFVTEAMYPNDQLLLRWTKDLRNLLESILETPAYATSGAIPSNQF